MCSKRGSSHNCLKKEDVRTDVIRSWDEDGNLSERQVRTVHIVQQKTGKKVVIPCNKALRTILDKYPNELPHGGLSSDDSLVEFEKAMRKFCDIPNDGCLVEQIRRTVDPVFKAVWRGRKERTDVFRGMAQEGFVADSQDVYFSR